MQDSNDLLRKAQTSLSASSTNIATEAGQTDSEEKLSSQQQEAVIGAVNQIFAEFELVYHNQYIKAFATLEKLRFAKQLWYSHLRFYPAEQIIVAARQVIQNSEYLPSIRGVIKYIEQDIDCFGLPDVRSAYLEACTAPSPKTHFLWRHVAVYHAGKSTGWYFLANNAEQKTFPVFQQYYLKLCQRIRQGDKLPEINKVSLSESVVPELSQNEQLKKIKGIQKKLKL